MYQTGSESPGFQELAISSELLAQVNPKDWVNYPLEFLEESCNYAAMPFVIHLIPVTRAGAPHLFYPKRGAPALIEHALEECTAQVSFA